jgi:hypothetical protein
MIEVDAAAMAGLLPTLVIQDLLTDGSAGIG